MGWDHGRDRFIRNQSDITSSEAQGRTGALKTEAEPVEMTKEESEERRSQREQGHGDAGQGGTRGSPVEPEQCWNHKVMGPSWNNGL